MGIFDVFLLFISGFGVWLVYSALFSIIGKIVLLSCGDNYIVTIKYKCNDSALTTEHTDEKYVKAFTAQEAYAKFIEKMYKFDEKIIVGYMIVKVSDV